MPLDQEIIKIAGGLAPIVPFADFRRNFKSRKWKMTEIESSHCGLSSWKREDQKNVKPLLILETEVMAYTNEEYDKYLVNQHWTREETDELMHLASIFHLKFIIMHDRFSGKKTIEEMKSRYYQINRIMLSKRNHKDLVGNYAFDVVKEQSRKQQLVHLLSRNEKQLKEEQMLFLEIKDFEPRREIWNDKRDYLYKIISHNAEAEASISEKSISMKKKKFKRKEEMGGVYLSSTRLSFIRPSMQQKVQFV